MRVITLPMPEGGSEREVCLYRRHGCKNAKAFRQALDNEDVDLLQFPVGLVGEGMPMGVPFPVPSSNACEVCGAFVGLWFQWKQRLVIA